MKKLQHCLLYLILFSTNFIFAQLSNQHWLPPLHTRVNNIVEDHYLYLSTPITKSFKVKVTDGAGNPIAGSPFDLSNANPVRIDIGDAQPSQMMVSQADLHQVLSDKGFILEGARDFYVSFRVRAISHAEILTSTGKTGLGTSFRLGSLPMNASSTSRNFVASIMATEDNTTVNLSEYDTGVEFATAGLNNTDDSQTFILNKGQSVVVSGYADVAANLKGFVGALLSSDKPVAVSTGNALGSMDTGGTGQDFALDQIVGDNQIGSEYILVRGNGSVRSEQGLVIAHQDNTEVYVNGTLFTTLQKGEYALLPDNLYQGSNHKNMYVKTSLPVFMYQILAGSPSDATVGMNFIPPLSCFYQKSVDVIPDVDKIGNTEYITDGIVITYADANIKVNGVAIPQSQAEPVVGNPIWASYRISNLSGGMRVTSDRPLGVGVFGFADVAGFGGYYAGFGSVPLDTDVVVCSNELTDILDKLEGNPETGGTWSPALASGTNMFNPAIDVPGEYTYTVVGLCATTVVKANVSIQTAPNAGADATLNICNDAAPVNLFSLLGSAAQTGGRWQPNTISNDGVFDPTKDTSGTYSYIFDGNDVCDEVKATVTVAVKQAPIVATVSNLEACDTNADGDDTNGSTTFNLTDKDSEAINRQANVSVTYYTNSTDAAAKVNFITSISTPNTTIYYRLENTSGCFAIGSFNLVVNPKPVTNAIVRLKQCDDDTDAVSVFNLTEANTNITSESNMVFTYFESLADANNNANTILNVTAYRSGNKSVWARSTNSKGCYRISEIQLVVSTTAIPATFKKTLQSCDVYRDAADVHNDGYDYFDLTTTTAEILTLFPAGQNLVVTYYENYNDALAERNKITNESNFRNTVLNAQTLIVRVDSKNNNDCVGLGPYVDLIVNPIPETDLGADFVLCINPVNNVPEAQTINATPFAAGSYSYSWTPANPTKDAFGNESSIYTIVAGGTYTVVITNTNTGCQFTDSIKVTPSSRPVMVKAQLISPLFSSGLATIEAQVVGGIGNYEYSIDGFNFQDSGVFTELKNGSYIITAQDKNGCGSAFSEVINTLTYPTYFTPNGDGYNERWNIANITLYNNPQLFIYDRYGKLLKQIDPFGEGWDGTYLGNPMPATDYWFKIEYTENNERKEFRSHFTLKR